MYMKHFIIFSEDELQELRNGKMISMTLNYNDFKPDDMILFVSEEGYKKFNEYWGEDE